MKFCKRCKVEKETSEFYKSEMSKDGLYTICKSCEKESQRHRRRGYSRRILREIEKTIKLKKECEMR